MENSAGKSGGAEIARKTRSLDLQSLYKSTVSVEQGNNKRKSGVVDDGQVKKKKRRSRKEVSLSSLEPAGKKARNSLDEVYGDGGNSDSLNSGRSQSGLRQNLDSSGGFNSISLNLDDSGNVIQIPKRRRGFVGRNKFESNKVSRLLVTSSGRVGGSVDQIAKLNGECKKFDGNEVSKSLGLPDGNVSSADQSPQLNDDSASKIVSPNVNGKTRFDDLKENRNSRVNSARPVKEEDGHLIVNNGDASSEKCQTDHGEKNHLASGSESRSKRKRNRNGLASGSESRNQRKRDGLASGSESRNQRKRDGLASGSESRNHRKRNGLTSDSQSRNHRKRNDLASGSESLAKKVEPLADSSNNICDSSQDEDEENLEQNAARMLSSRFDTSCTGFPLKSKCLGSPSTNRFPLFVSSGLGVVNSGANSSAGFESASVDAASRVLRPRKYHKEEGLLRKRRHFYEVLSKDLDAYWLLNRRIKVFWPLDESWYYGLVNDYDTKRNLHHIKYDDRDEEWINLRNERFKLLLLPSEVPHKMDAKTSMGNERDNDGKRDLATDDDSFLGSHLDSEPIISWLARASRQVKSSLGVSKRRKTSHPSSHFVPAVLSSNTDDPRWCLDMGSSKRGMNKSSNCALPDGYTDIRSNQKSVLEGTSSSKDSKSPVVYFRRRLRNKDKGLINAPDGKNACRSALVSVTSLGSTGRDLCASKVSDISFGHLKYEGLSWSVDNSGLLKLTFCLVESKQLRFELGPSVPILGYLGVANSWLLHTMLLVHYGTVMTTWPKIHLEMLFVDNFVGLRFLLFEGGLKQAVTFVFQVLRVFYQANEQRECVDMQMPVTSIRFKLSCIGDLRKHHVFAFYSFSKVKKSKWLYLDCKLQQHCLFTKQLPLSECTYDNIKALEGGCNYTNSIDSVPSTFEGLRKKSVQGLMPVGSCRESCRVATNLSFSNSDVKHGKFRPFALSFSAAPTFFLSLHLKLLMENSVACINLRDHDTRCSLDHSENTGLPVVDGCTLIQGFSEYVSEITPEENPRTSLREAESSGWLLRAKSQLGSDAISECSNGGFAKSSQNNGKLSIVETSACSTDPEENSGIVMLSQKSGFHCLESEQFITSLQPLVAKNHVSVDMSESRFYSSLRVEIPSLDQVERPADGRSTSSTQSSDLAWNMGDAIVNSPNPLGPRSIWHHSRNSLSSSFRDASHVWPNRKADFIHNGFGNGPRKPRTQVQYTLPSGVFDFSSKHKMHNQRGLPYKRIRKANEKRTFDESRNSHRNLEVLACDANVLITTGDRGWRECGAQVVLELADRNEWKLAVKFTGSTKYSYKAHQFLQPGSTNRYTHAMMWKGGKDWVLEFPDRSQWMLFKEMHEECYNRNIRAASVKNIPIPGVRLIEESDDNGMESPFVRCSPKYFQQVDNDVDMAMDPSHILYDMDSEDEKWISEIQKGSHTQGSKCQEISEQLFEKTMDMLEKVAYSKQRDHFTSDEIEKFMVGVGPIEAIKAIHEHWQLKRQRKGIPLIRHLQIIGMNFSTEKSVANLDGPQFPFFLWDSDK
ncbi:hypothetical protein U1Q18_021794 [Sarracenia purpurea var. burkii]